VSRLFWSELILDLGSMHRPCGTVDQLDVRRGHDEVWTALHAAADAHPSDDLELERYARFRGVQEVWGRNWRDWPEPARSGDLSHAAYDEATAGFHRRAQQMVRAQLEGLATRLGDQGVHLGLDLTVGVHADGYDAWSRQHLFASGMSVGAPPDPGFPSGQDWGFAPMLPAASRQEGHRYLAESLRHQMQVAGVLRIDHIMALARLYWIPHGMGLHEGTYVSYPADELFAVITLESWRSRCEVIGENLGNVPPEVNAALARHQILGLYLAMFQATGPDTAAPPMPDDVALIGSHDTPTLHGWLMGEDIDDRMRHGLLEAQDLSRAREEREAAAAHLMDMLGLPGASPDQLLHGLLQWLGRSPAAWVVPWLEDLWLEPVGVNLPGTPASVRGNWQRPMRLTLEHVRGDHQVLSCLATLREARAAATH
jgi:4-alpha-glucanotransferase